MSRASWSQTEGDRIRNEWMSRESKERPKVAIELWLEDCRKGMAAELADASVDAIVTDPPYEQGFVGQSHNKGISEIGGQLLHGLRVDQEKTWSDTGVAFDPETWKQCLRVAKPGAWLLAFSATRLVHRLATVIEASGWDIRDQLVWAYTSGMNHAAALPGGRKSNLKPAWEPIIMARKPFDGTLDHLVKSTGVGGVNIEEGRIPRAPGEKETLGREPSNILISEPGVLGEEYDRIFLIPKPNAKEREGNTHPTVKPVALMAALVRLVTPKRGLVLDPFCGSGSTMVAVKMEGFNGVTFDITEEYLDIAERRLQF